MTYTTASGVVIPQGTDAFNPPAQYKTWADKAATYEYFTSVQLDSDRTALAAPEKRDGLYCYVRATKILWVYDGAWKPWESDWISATPIVTAQSGSFVSVTATLRWKYSAGAAVYLISVNIGSAGTASGNILVAMPFTAGFVAAAAGMNQSTGTSVWGVMFSGENALRVNTYNNGGATATGNLLHVSGTVLI